MGRQYDVSVVVGLKDQASAGLVKLNATATRTFGQLARAGRWSVGGLERGLATLGRKALWASAALGGTAGLGLRTVINSFGSYEQSVRNAVSVTGLIGREAEEAERAMFDLGLLLSRTSTFGGPEIAQVFYELASAGLSVKESMQAARGVIALSEGTLSDVGETAMLVTSQLAAFGLGTEQTDRLVNVLAATTSATLMKMTDLATALPYVGAAARSLALDVEVTAAALGLLRSNGLDASMAGTALRMALTALARQTPMGIKVLKRYGLSMRDLDVSVHGLVPVLERLRKAHISYADAVSLFGVRGVLAFNILTRQLESLVDLRRKITATTMAYQMQSRQLATVQGRWKVLKSTLDEVAVRIGKGVAPALRELLALVTAALGRGVDVGLFARWGEQVGAVLERLTKWIAGGGAAHFAAAVGTMVQRALGTAREFGAGLVRDWHAVVANLGATAGGIYSWLVGGGEFPADVLGALARSVAQGLRDAVGQAIASLRGAEVWAALGRLVAEAFSLTPAEAEAVMGEWRGILADVGRNLLAILQGVRALVPHILAGIGQLLKLAGEHPALAQFGILLAIFQKLTGLLPLLVGWLARGAGWLARITGLTKWLAELGGELGRVFVPVLGKIAGKFLGVLGVVLSLYDIVRTLLAALGAWRAGREAAAKGRQVQELLGTSGRLQDVLEAPITPEQLGHARGALGLGPARTGGVRETGVRGQVLQYRPAAVPAPVWGGRAGPTSVAVNVHVEAPVYGVDDLEAKIQSLAARQVRDALAPA